MAPAPPVEMKTSTTLRAVLDDEPTTIAAGVGADDGSLQRTGPRPPAPAAVAVLDPPKPAPAPVAEPEVVVQRPVVQSATHLLRPEDDWGPEQVRDYVVGQMKRLRRRSPATRARRSRSSPPVLPALGGRRGADRQGVVRGLRRLVEQRADLHQPLLPRVGSLLRHVDRGEAASRVHLLALAHPLHHSA